ncbi:MAG TPA: L,D-transpeptidase family protein, partial [Planctomycetota bacterium]|nr:L,D-transpeptidase family protein [Planctomycetota bacterium]
SEADAAAAKKLYDRANAAQGDAAFELYAQAASKYPDTWAGREAQLQLGNIHYGRGELKQALDAYEKCLPNLQVAGREHELTSARDTIRFLKARLAADVGDSTLPAAIETEYVVQAGDSFSTVARKFRVSVQQLKLANGRTTDFVREGEKLRVTRKMPFLIVSKKALTLELHFDGKRVKTYRVGIGKEDLTPTGVFTVIERLKNPVWHRPGQPALPNNDPANILGSRWLTLVGEDNVKRGYGIHGTTRPETVPGRESAGCIRMLNPDVEELFEWVPARTVVRITDT